MGCMAQQAHGMHGTAGEVCPKDRGEGSRPRLRTGCSGPTMEKSESSSPASTRATVRRGPVKSEKKPLPASACLKTLTSPIHLKVFGYLPHSPSSICLAPALRCRLGKVAERMRCSRSSRLP